MDLSLELIKEDQEKDSVNREIIGDILTDPI